jgi:multiple sugar transport system permease protein
VKKTLHVILLSILVLLVLIFIYLPVAWLVISSISTRSELLSTPIHWIPQQPTLQNYINIIFPAQGTSEVAKTFRITLWNSLLVASSVTVIALVFGSLASYALVRLRFPFQRSMLIGILGTRMIPEISLVIPLYLFATRFGLFNSPSILIITYLSFALPFAIWLMAAFFDTIPVELEDAARIDGCNRIETLWKIIMPISAPGLVSTGLFVFLTAWDEFFFALILTSTINAKTVPVAIAEFTGRYVVDVGGMMTGGVLAAIPPVLLSLIFQRYIVSGLTAGAVKG